MKFDFYMPTRIISGENCVAANAGLFALGKKCLVVTGKSSAIKSGALDDVSAAFRFAGVEYIVYDKINENPLLSVCAEGGRAAAEYGADFIVGIGGGSPLDAAKAIAAFAANDGIDQSALFDVSALKPSLPLIAIPTTAGTGSEVNPYSILTLDGESKKRTFNSVYSYFKYAFVDPKYTYSLNGDYTLSTALDAFCHCIESYLSPKSNETSRMFAVYGAKHIWETFMAGTAERASGKISEQVCAVDAAGYTRRQREALSYAATAGGIAIGATGTGFPHPLGYNLTLFNGIPHGKACAAFIGLFIEYNKRDPEGARLLDEFAAAIGTGTDEISGTITKLADVKLELDGNNIDVYIDKVKTASNFMNSPYKINENEMKTVYTRLFGKPI